MTALANTNTSYGHLPGTVGTGETFWNLYCNRQTQHNETSIVTLGISSSWCCLSLGEKRLQRQHDIQDLEMEHRAGKGMSFGSREKNSIETEAANVRRSNGNIRQIVQFRPQVWTPIVSASKVVEDTNYSGEEPNIITLDDLKRQKVTKNISRIVRTLIKVE